MHCVLLLSTSTTSDFHQEIFMKKFKFSDTFIFGAATAAYQAEGATRTNGRGLCAWDEFFHQPSSRFNADTASDFYHTYKDDLKLAKEHGLNGLRISIAWSRIFPAGFGAVNEAGVAFYHHLIDACWAAGVEPFVTLHHFDTPLPLFKEGDWLNRTQIDHFETYARLCFKEYGQKVKHWITINEPVSVAFGQYIVGHFPPQIKYDVPKAINALHNMTIAHGRVAKIYKELGLDGKIGIVHILESKYPISNSEQDKKAALIDDTLANSFVLDGCLHGSYRPETLSVINTLLKTYGAEELVVSAEDTALMQIIPQHSDFVGINYYASHFVQHYEGESQIVHNGTGDKGTSIFANKGVGQRVANPAIETTDWDWPIYPQGLFDMLTRIRTQYPQLKAIYVTENGMGAKDELVDGTVNDTERIDYVNRHLQAVGLAIEAGVPVKGYFMWSLFDLFSWTNGYNKRYGFFYVDFATQKRYPKASAAWWKNLAHHKTLTLPTELK